MLDYEISFSHIIWLNNNLHNSIILLVKNVFNCRIFVVFVLVMKREKNRIYFYGQNVYSLLLIDGVGHLLKSWKLSVVFVSYSKGSFVHRLFSWPFVFFTHCVCMRLNLTWSIYLSWLRPTAVDREISAQQTNAGQIVFIFSRNIRLCTNSIFRNDYF